MRKLLLLSTLTTTLAMVAFGYYPWVRYNSRTGFVASPSKFDLNALPNKTVYYFISENGPTGLLPNDSVTAIHSQIRAAAKVWDGVETSDIRVAFGGMRAAGAPPSSTPSIDVLFEEMPPGTLSMGGPLVEDDDGAAANQPFIPILRSVVMLPRNFPAISAPCPCPSWSEFFFTTVVHEFGHALGLQHSFSSGVMSLISTRGTTKAKPLAADDVAGVSWLYPARAFASTFGSIAGRVTTGNTGVAYASVVALSTTGAAVSALTHPDGTYRIDGLPQGQYTVYAHALPPNADIRAALDVDRREIPFPAQAFDTQFFPNSRNWNTAVPVPVNRGASAEGVNFNVTLRRTPLSIHNPWTYSFPTGQVAVHPSHVQVSPFLDERFRFVLAAGPGLTGPNNQPVPGLTVSVLGGSPSVTGIRQYENTQYVRIDFAFNIGQNEGAYHLVFSTPTDTYVLPAGFTLVGRPAPFVTSVTPGVDASGRFLTVAGTGFRDDTRLMVDGVLATQRSFDGQRLVVSVPPAPLGHRGTVIALNSDGQSSAFSQSSPFTFSFDTDFGASLAAAPPATLSANTTLPAGVESLVEITGLNTAFAEGQVQAGFHTSDAVVRRLWVVSPTRLLANVWISPNAAPGLYPLTVVSGLSSLSAPAALQVAAPNARQLSATPVSAPAGATVPVTLNGFTGGTLTATVNDRPAPIAGVNGNTILVQLPAGLPVGPAILRFATGADQSLPIAISIEPPPPIIIAAFGTGNVLIDNNRPARPLETIRLMTQGLSDAKEIPLTRVVVTIAGQEHPVTRIDTMGGAGGHEVLVQLSSTLPATVPNGLAQTTITIDGRTSAVFNLPVRQ